MAETMAIDHHNAISFLEINFAIGRRNYLQLPIIEYARTGDARSADNPLSSFRSNALPPEINTLHSTSLRNSKLRAQ